jgi:hypothetical protein
MTNDTKQVGEGVKKLIELTVKVLVKQMNVNYPFEAGRFFFCLNVDKWICVDVIIVLF